MLRDIIEYLKSLTCDHKWKYLRANHISLKPTKRICTECNKVQVSVNVWVDDDSIAALTNKEFL